MKWTVCIISILAAIAPLTAGCGGESTAWGAAKPRTDPPRPNVLIISIDMLRPDHLGCYGYSRPTSPNMDRLAADGALLEQAVSSAPWTLPAHAALFTGLADSVHGCLNTDNRLADGHTTLAERLRRAGYQTVGFFSGPYLHPLFGLSQGFDEYFDCTGYPEISAEAARKSGRVDGPKVNTAAHEDVTSPRILERVAHWLSGRRDKPFFMFIHMWDVHFDFLPPPPYDRKFDPDYGGPLTGRGFLHDKSINADMPRRDLEHLIALYDGEIAWTDEHVGRILAALDQRGLRDSTLVILLADHGTEFLEHGGKAHRRTLFDEVIRIPLIVRFPGRIAAGTRVRTQARMIDVLPTVLDAAGLAAAEDVMGRSLLPILRGEKPAEEVVAISELLVVAKRLRSFRRLDGKLLIDEASGAAQVFDLAADPRERSPLLDMRTPLARSLMADARTARKQLDQWRQSHKAEDAPSAITPEIERQLGGLGYLGGDSTPTSQPASRP